MSAPGLPVQAVDENGNVEALATLEAQSPSGQLGLGTKVTTTNWDANSPVAIPANAQFLHVTVDQDIFLICDNLSTTYAGAGTALYLGNDVYKIDCRGQTYLHYKSLSVGGNIYATAFFSG